MDGNGAENEGGTGGGNSIEACPLPRIAGLARSCDHADADPTPLSPLDPEPFDVGKGEINDHPFPVLSSSYVDKVL